MKMFVPFTWRPRGLSKSVISRVIIRGVTPFRVLITLLMTHFLASLGLQVAHRLCLVSGPEKGHISRKEPVPYDWGMPGPLGGL